MPRLGNSDESNMQFNFSSFETACPGVPQQPRLNPMLMPAMLFVADLPGLRFAHHLTACLSPEAVSDTLAYGTTIWAAITPPGHRVTIAFDWALTESRVLVVADMLSIRSNLLLVDSQRVSLNDAGRLTSLATAVNKLGWQAEVKEYLLRILPALGGTTRC